MSGRSKLIVILVFLAILSVIGVFAVRQALGRRVSMNEISEYGNTAGNLNNGGYFCEEDGVVYFSNPLDFGCLYSMNPDETGYKKLSTMSVRNILSAGRFVYCYMDSSTRSVSQGIGNVVQEYGIYRMRNDGKYTVCLLKEVVSTMQLGGSYIYYQQGDDRAGTLNRIRIDKKERTGYGNTPAFYDENINPSAYLDGVIYYPSVTLGHNLYALNVEREPLSPMMVFSYNVTQPIVQGSFVYFLNAADEYRICRYNVGTGAVETLSTYGADCYNLNGTTIYYDSQTADTPGLYRMDINGNGETMLFAGAYSALHLTSTHLYFRIFGSGDTFYHIPLYGNALPTMFQPEAYTD
ncbi:MAG: DUF5050 domain-containing protein [Lachnospiraceae bacterium]|nr:DUF5050 domain-containing protein [Lachnospiraceae bacterium]